MSGLFGGTKNLPEAPQKPLGLDAAAAATNEQARPIPFFAGKARLGITFITEPYKEENFAVIQSTGKQESVSGHTYFAWIAGLLCHGPVDAIYSIYVNQERIWGRAANAAEPERSREGGEHSVDINIPKFGALTLYWGTDDQPVSPWLTPTGNNHPAYRGFCYVVFHSLYLGFNQTNFPNIEFVLGRYPAPGWFTAPKVIGGDANPVAIIGDLLQNRRLLFDLPESLLDTEACNAAAEFFEEWQYGLSPVLNRAMEARQFLAALTEYFDGHLTEAGGKISVRVSRPAEDVEALPVLTADMMVSRPGFTPEDWSQTTNSVRLKFTDASKGLKENAVNWRDGGARRVVDLDSMANLDRAWVTRPSVAARMAAVAGARAGLPALKGKVRLNQRAEWDDLPPGASFTMALPDRNLADLVFRVTERSQSDPARPEFEIGFVRDDSVLTDFLHPTFAAGAGGEEWPDDPLPRPEPEPEPGPPTEEEHVAVVELPVALCPEGKLSLAVLAASNAPGISGFSVYHEKVQDGEFTDSYELLLTSGNLAAHGMLAVPIGAADDTLLSGISVIFSAAVDLGDPTLFDAESNDLLLFSGDEIFSVAGFELLGTNSYKLFCLRGRFATAPAAHVAEGNVWMVSRQALTVIQHEHFQPLNTCHFKVEAFSGGRRAGLENVTVREKAIEGRIYRLPVDNVRVNGQLAGAVYVTRADIETKWTLTEGGRDFDQPGRFAKKTVLEIYDASDALVDTQELAAGVNSYSLTNADLVTLLGGETDFSVAVRAKIITDTFELFSPARGLAVQKI